METAKQQNSKEAILLMASTQKMILVFIFFFFSFGLGFAQSQLTTQPRGSQAASSSQIIGITNIEVSYHRPAVKEREVWGKMVSYNAGIPWRAGANENTIISFSTDVSIEGKPLKAGTYGLHMIPTEKQWTIIFSHNSTSWGSFSYNPAEDALRVDVTPKETVQHWENLTYLFNDVETNSTTCLLLWDKKQIGFKISADVNELTFANLQKELRDKAGWTWVGWNEAANFCLNNDTHLQQGFNWAARSVFMNANTGNMMTKAKLQAKINNDTGTKAIETIVTSLETDLNSNQVTWKEWQAVGNYCLQNKLTDKALAFTSKAVEMNPNMTALMTKVAVFQEMGKDKDAKKLKEVALKKGTNTELNNYGYQLLFSGKTQEAVEVFEANAKNNPSDPNVWDSLGEGYMTTGQNEKAIEALRKCISMNPLPGVKTNSLKNLKLLGVEL